MDNNKREDDDKSNSGQGRNNNPESERLKILKEEKNFTSEKLLNEEKEENIGNLEKNKNIVIEKILEENIYTEKEEDDILDVNDDNLEIERKTINIETTTVGEVLKEEIIEKKENFNVLKFSLNFLVKKEFKWIVYRTPKETIKFFKKLYKSIKNDENAIQFGFISILEQLKDYKEQEILIHTEEIKNELLKMLQSSYFKNNILLNEFLNIGGSSFSQYNGGIKPFEGWGEKKADPHCMRKVFGYVCKCLECCIFKQYNQRWIVLKDDMITYSDLSVSPGGKHVYFFDEEIRAVRSGKTNIKITNLSRMLELKFKNYFERELWKHEIDERIKKFKTIIKNNRYKA